MSKTKSLLRLEAEKCRAVPMARGTAEVILGRMNGMLRARPFFAVCDDKRYICLNPEVGEYYPHSHCQPSNDQHEVIIWFPISRAPKLFAKHASLSCEIAKLSWGLRTLGGGENSS